MLARSTDGKLPMLHDIKNGKAGRSQYIQSERRESKYRAARGGKGKVHGSRRLQLVTWAKLSVLAPIPLFLQSLYCSISSRPSDGGKEWGIRFWAAGESTWEEGHQRTLAATEVWLRKRGCYRRVGAGEGDGDQVPTLSLRHLWKRRKRPKGPQRVEVGPGQQEVWGWDPCWPPRWGGGYFSPGPTGSHPPTTPPTTTIRGNASCKLGNFQDSDSLRPLPCTPPPISPSKRIFGGPAFGWNFFF